jgi:hypothetical protein
MTGTATVVVPSTIRQRLIILMSQLLRAVESRTDRE